MVTHQDAGQIDMYVRMYDDLNAKMVIIQQQEFFYVQKQTRISLDIQYYMTTTGCLCQSIWQLHQTKPIQLFLKFFSENRH